MRMIRFYPAWLGSLALLVSLLGAPARAEDAPAAAPPAASPAEAPTAPATAGGGQLPAADSKKPPSLEVTGFVDLYYEHNFDRPPAYNKGPGGAKMRNDPENKLRNFDFRNNEFALNMAEVVLQRAPAPIGFTLNLAYGKATDWIHQSEPGGEDNYRYVLQAYATSRLKFWGKKDTIDVGKFVTHHSAEVIATTGNWNYTRSFLFSWAIPYYHMGLRYTHPFNDTDNLRLFLYNGWNDVEDNNNSPSLGASYTKTFGRKLALVQNWTGGPELNDDNKHWRHLFDTVLNYTVNDKTAAGLNFDYGHQSLPQGSAKWMGVAGYLRQALNKRHAVAARAEWFEDPDGFMTGTRQTLYEVTITYEMKFRKRLLFRTEFRNDWSNQAVFDKNGGMAKTQPTLLAGTVYSF